MQYKRDLLWKSTQVHSCGKALTTEKVYRILSRVLPYVEQVLP